MLAPEAPFTSEYGMLIGFGADHPDRGGGKMIVATDGPGHARLRRILGRFLTPAARAASTADAHTEIFFYFHDRIAECRRNPGPGLISALLATDEVLANCYNLLIGGNQTSRTERGRMPVHVSAM